MNKVKPFFRVEIGASEKSADINNIRKIFFFYHVPKATKIRESHKISS